MEPIIIDSYSEITNSFIMDMIQDEFYEMTKAYKTFPEKEIFCEKINDRYTRYLMLKPLVVLKPNNNIYNKIFGDA